MYIFSFYIQGIDVNTYYILFPNFTWIFVY